MSNNGARLVSLRVPLCKIAPSGNQLKSTGLPRSVTAKRKFVTLLTEAWCAIELQPPLRYTIRNTYPVSQVGTFPPIPSCSPPLYSRGTRGPASRNGTRPSNKRARRSASVRPQLFFTIHTSASLSLLDGEPKGYHAKENSQATGAGMDTPFVDLACRWHSE